MAANAAPPPWVLRLAERETPHPRRLRPAPSAFIIGECERAPPPELPTAADNKGWLKRPRLPPPPPLPPPLPPTHNGGRVYVGEVWRRGGETRSRAERPAAWEEEEPVWEPGEWQRWARTRYGGTEQLVALGQAARALRDAHGQNEAALAELAGPALLAKLEAKMASMAEQESESSEESGSEDEEAEEPFSWAKLIAWEVGDEPSESEEDDDAEEAEERRRRRAKELASGKAAKRGEQRREEAVQACDEAPPDATLGELQLACCTFGLSSVGTRRQLLRRLEEHREGVDRAPTHAEQKRIVRLRGRVAAAA